MLHYNHEDTQDQRLQEVDCVTTVPDNEVVILLCGGDKSTQQKDIAKAKRIAGLPLEEEE